MPDREKFQVLMAGGEAELDPESRHLLRDTPWQIRFLSDHELSLAYSGAAALVYPSLYEGFGLPLLESMQSGCPVITGRASSLPEVAGDAALYLEKPDESHMLKALQRVQRPDVRDMMVARGLQRAGHFSWQRSAALFLDAIDSALAVRGGQGAERVNTSLRTRNIRLSSPKPETPNATDVTPFRFDPTIQVSAIVSAFASENFIRGCLQDLVAQTLYKKGGLEIIVVDSGSPQQEGAVVREFQTRHANISYLRTEKRETLYQAWNRAIRAARGNYITSANTDDRHRRDALERMADELEKRPEVALVYADVLKTATANESFDRCTPTGRYRWHDWDRKVLLTKGCFIGPQPMWRRRVHEFYGGFDERLVSSGDFEFWLRISQTFDFHHIREPLGLYLESPDSLEHRDRERKNAEDARVVSLYWKAAANGEILRCTPLEELKSCRSQDRLMRIAAQVELLAGLAPMCGSVSHGRPPFDVGRWVELKRQILQADAPVARQMEMVRLVSTLLLERTVWYQHCRDILRTGKRPAFQEPVKGTGGRLSVVPAGLTDPGPAIESAELPEGRLDEAAVPPQGVNLKAYKALAHLRMEQTRFWMKAPAPDLARFYSGEPGKLHRRFVSERPPDLLPFAEERRTAAGLVERFERGGFDQEPGRFLILAMLFFSPLNMPPRIDFMKVPEWLRFDYASFLLNVRGHFQEPGEVEAYLESMDQLTAWIRNAIQSNPPSPGWQEIALHYAEKANFLPLYFSRRNLKQIAVGRGEICEYAMRHRKQELEYAVAPHRAVRTKLRLGIHCHRLRPNTETFALLPVFEYLDRNLFEIHVYVHAATGDSIEDHVRRQADTLTVLPESTKQCVEAIRSGDLDILFFGNNINAVQTPGSVLARYRMARVQCIHFCNPVTSGKRHIDFFILGRQVGSPEDVEAYFSERILPIDGSGICFDLMEPEAGTFGHMSREDLNIAQSSPLFVSGANYFKIIPELRHTWAKILAQVPDSVLVLYPFGPAWAADYPKRLLVEELHRVFAAYGLGPRQLVVVDTLEGRSDVLALNRLADIYLDAVPYNGATSLLDPLLTGIPPVVANGRELRFSQGAAILRELGCPELIARDEEDYIRLAVRLGTDPRLREAMRERIRTRMSIGADFLNPRLYAQRISSAFRGLFEVEAHPGGEHYVRVGVSRSTPQLKVA